MTTQYVKISQNRIGALIGHKGIVKEDIEKKSGSKITVDSNEGEVYIESVEGGDPLKAFRAVEVIRAIGRGFSPENAFALLDDDLLILEVISLAHLTSKTLNRMKGRVIGRNGRARRAIEKLADVEISVYGKTVSLIGHSHRVRTAREAVAMLIAGASHSSVYKFLERKRRAEKEEQESGE